MDFLSAYLMNISAQNAINERADARNFQQSIIDRADNEIKAKREADALEKKELKESGEAGRPAKLANLLSQYKTGNVSLDLGKQALEDYYGNPKDFAPLPPEANAILEEDSEVEEENLSEIDEAVPKEGVMAKSGEDSSESS